MEMLEEHNIYRKKYLGDNSVISLLLFIAQNKINFKGF